MTPREIKQRNNRFIFYICLLILACAGHFWSGYQLGRLNAEKEWYDRLHLKRAQAQTSNQVVKVK